MAINKIREETNISSTFLIALITGIGIATGFAIFKKLTTKRR